MVEIQFSQKDKLFMVDTWMLANEYYLKLCRFIAEERKNVSSKYFWYC